MEPKAIKALLGRYASKIRAPEKYVIEAFQASVCEVCAFSIEAHEVSYRVGSRTLVLACAGPKKTELLLRKRELLACLAENLPEQSAPTELI